MVIPALAYIDPGGGSLLLQLIVGFAVGTGLFFRAGLMRFFRLLRRS